MKTTAQATITVALMICAVLIATVIIARAQQHCTTTYSPYGGANGSGTSTTTCVPLQPPVTHRYTGPSAAEQNYQDRAYEYELRQLDRENRR